MRFPSASRVVLVLALALAPGVLLACCLSDTRPFPERFKSIQAVFVGEVEAVTCTERWQHPIDGTVRCNVQQATFHVTRAWTPAVSRTAIVTANPGTSVGYEFQIGRSYLVLAASRKGQLWTGVCAGTVPKEGAESTLEELDHIGSGYIPE